MATWPWPFRLLWGHNPSFYDTSTMAAPGLWTALTNCAIDPTGGYDGSGALIFDESTSGVSMGSQLAEFPNLATKHTRLVPDTQNLMIGSRFYMPASPPAAVTPVQCVLNDVGYVQCCLCVDTDGKLAVYRGIPGSTAMDDVLLWTSADPVGASDHHRLGFITSLQSGTGWFDVDLDGVLLAYVSGLTNYLYGPPNWYGVGFGGTEDMKHSHMFFGSGIPQYEAKIRRGGFLSSVKYPAADGTFTDWVSNTASIATAIDDAVPDDPTTVIESESAGQTFSVSVDDVVGSRAIIGCQTSTRYLRPDAASTNALRPAVIVNDVVYPANQIASGDADEWRVEQYLWLSDPSNGLPFTRARLNDPAITQWGGLAHGS